VVRGSDIVSTVTTSATPLFNAEWLSPGTHINAAGSNSLIRRELGEDVLKRCSPIVVDSVETAEREAGDLLPVLEKGRLHARDLLELGEVICGRHAGRSTTTRLRCSSHRAWPFRIWRWPSASRNWRASAASVSNCLMLVLAQCSSPRGLGPLAAVAAGLPVGGFVPACDSLPPGLCCSVMGEYVTNSLLGALEIVVRTDPGLVRGQNEDSVFADADHGLAILADGMGGYNAGEVASSMATTLLARQLAEAFKVTAVHEQDIHTGSRLRGVRSGSRLRR
jgi:hypothetical protein